MNYKHGISIIEQATSLLTPVETTASLQVIVGTAPVNLLDNPYNATNKIMIAYNFAEACEKVGYSDDFKNYTLCQSIDACFRRFSIAPIVLINVLDPKKHCKENEAMVYQIQDGTVKIAIDGILRDTIEVKTEDGSKTYVKDEDYVVGFNSEGYAIVAFISNVPVDKVKISSKSIAPEQVTIDDIIGGYDVQTKEEMGLELIRQVYPKLGLVPGLILAPGWSHNAEVCAVMEAKCEHLNGMFTCQTIVDIDTTQAITIEDIKIQKEKLGAVSNHTIVCWPKVAVGEKVYYFSAFEGALIAYTDSINEDVPSHTPSNKSLKITAPVLENGKEVLLDLDQANFVNSLGVCTALNINGWNAWGNQTACFPKNTDPKDADINCRRFFSWFGNGFILTFFKRVDDLANYRLIESIVDTERVRCNGYVARGHMAGADIKFLQEENPIVEILNGTIRFHIYMAPYTVAKFIPTILEFDPTKLRDALFEQVA